MSEPTVQDNPAKSPSELRRVLQQQFKVIAEHLPLAIGIDKQIVAQMPDINRKLMRSALGGHTKSVRYLKALQTSPRRFNLDGTEADEISDEQRALAAKTLKEFFKKRAEQKKAELAAETAERERAEKLNKLVDKFSRS